VIQLETAEFLSLYNGQFFALKWEGVSSLALIALKLAIYILRKKRTKKEVSIHSAY